MMSIAKTVRDSLREAEAGDIPYYPLSVAEFLFSIACQPPEPEPTGPVAYSRAADSAPAESTDAKQVVATKRPPPWCVGLSKNFSKAIVGIDRKLQGRILEALNDISSDPLTPRGDTVKPLQGDLRGCWRYRIGSYRLIYSADLSTGDITLLAFAARGSSYDG